MNNTIHSTGLKQAALQNSPQNKAGTASAEAGAQTPGPQGDSVQLTASAQAIGQASRIQGSSAPVDAAHVQRVRQALASGNYNVDATRIADKLLKVESQIGGKG